MRTSRTKFIFRVILLVPINLCLVGASIFSLVMAYKVIDDGVSPGLLWIPTLIMAAAVVAIIALNISTFASVEWLSRSKWSVGFIVGGLLIGIAITAIFIFAEGYEDFLRNPFFWAAIYFIPLGLAFGGLFKINRALNANKSP